MPAGSESAASTWILTLGVEILVSRVMVLLWTMIYNNYTAVLYTAPSRSPSHQRPFKLFKVHPRIQPHPSLPSRLIILLLISLTSPKMSSQIRRSRLDRPAKLALADQHTQMTRKMPGIVRPLGFL